MIRKVFYMTEDEINRIDAWRLAAVMITSSVAGIIAWKLIFRGLLF